MKEVNHNHMDSCLQDKILAGRVKSWNSKNVRLYITKLIEKIRNKIPDVTLRTSLIVGFPDETQEDFNELLEFVKKAEFDKLGAFMYSKEEGTPAAKMENQIHGNTKKSRYNKLMKLQQEISNQNLKKRVGNTCFVLVENMSFDRKYYIGRTMQDAPDIDGVVFIKNDTEKDLMNTFVKCKLVEVCNDYDFIATLIEK